MSGDHCGLLGLSLLSTLWKLCGLHLRIRLASHTEGRKSGRVYHELLFSIA